MRLRHTGRQKKKTEPHHDRVKVHAARDRSLPLCHAATPSIHKLVTARLGDTQAVQTTARSLTLSLSLSLTLPTLKHEISLPLTAFARSLDLHHRHRHRHFQAVSHTVSQPRAAHDRHTVASATAVAKARAQSQTKNDDSRKLRNQEETNKRHGAVFWIWLYIFYHT